jgi:hypothetical protein
MLAVLVRIGQFRISERRTRNGKCRHRLARRGRARLSIPAFGAAFFLHAGVR